MAVVNVINLGFGTGTIHVTVVDQNGNPLNPADITWEISDPTIVEIQPDATGVNFGINTTVANSQSTTATATYQGPGNPDPVIGPELTINVAGTAMAPTVTSLQYMSP